MSCKEFKDKFDERLDGRLGESERTAFDAHLASCVDCHREWQAYAAAWTALERHADITPSFGFVERTLRRLTEPLSVRERFWQPAYRWAALATGVAALTVVAWVGHERLAAQRRADIYAGIRQADYLEDFDVIASLDQLNPARSGVNGGDKL